MWQQLPFEHAAAPELVARSSELLDAVAADGLPTLRWYRSTAPALVLGRGQDTALPRTDDLPIVVRPSGGGAVLLDGGLLSLDVVLPTGHPLLAGALGDVFIRLGEAWARALDLLGCPNIEVFRGAATAKRRGSPREQLLAAICYATLGRGEVTVSGRKILGLSQRRRRHGALVQCGLLRRWDPAPLLAAYGAVAADPDVLTAAVGLDELTPTQLTDEAIIATVQGQLERVEAAP